jgi:hypothetical protein
MPRDNWLGLRFFALVMIAQIGNILFAILPIDYKPFGILINGLPLGWLWYSLYLTSQGNISNLDGRKKVYGLTSNIRSTDVILATCSASFIISSGIAKDIGLKVMGGWGITGNIVFLIFY